MKKSLLFQLLLSLFCTVQSQNYSVGHTTITFNDPSRTGGFGSGGGSGRQIQTEIYYPSNTNGNNVAVANGEFPIIVFGHGFAMAWDAYQNIWEAMVPEGYIIAFPRTEGSLIPAPSHSNFGLDLALVEIKMQALNTNASSLFFQKIKNKSCIMGHSMGGGATFLAASGNTSTTLKCVVGLAPAETNPSAITAASSVNKNALIFSGSSDGVTPPASNHQPIYNNLISGCKTFLSIPNGSHCYFANTNFNCDFGELTTGTGSLPRAEQQDITEDFLKLWLDFELKTNCNSWDIFLDSLAVSTRVVEQQSCSFSYLEPNLSLNGNQSVCDGQSYTIQAAYSGILTFEWYVNNQVQNNSTDTFISNQTGEIYAVAQNNFGCTYLSDTILINNYPNYFVTDTQQACIGAVFTFIDGTTATINQTHENNLQSSNGCDSIVSQTVTFGNEVVSTINAQVCFGDSFLYNNLPIINDTTFNDTLTGATQFGCDSIVLVNISLNAIDTFYQLVELCEGENYQLPTGLFVNETDTFYFNYNGQLGCDSIYFIDLQFGQNIELLDTIIETSNDTILLHFESNIPIDSFYFNNVNIQFLFASNDTFYFQKLSSGLYEISGILFAKGCMQSFDILELNTGIKTQHKQMNVYPNPVQSVLFLPDGVHEIEITNLLGQELLNQKLNKEIKQIEVTGLAKGSYFLKTNIGVVLFQKE